MFFLFFQVHIAMFNKIYSRLFLLFLTFFLQNIAFPQNVVLTSSNLPIFVINTYGTTIPDEPKITANLHVIFNGPGKINKLADTTFHYNGPIGIELRGSSSASYPKKQYAVEIRDSLGNDSDFSLLGLPAESDWVLYAPYSDKSCVRDVLMYTLGGKLGWYASRSRYCEVVLNGQYQGMYILLEKIKRNKNRVNVSKCQAADTSGDALTGGYIYKIDKTTGADVQGWNSSYLPYSGSPFRIYYQYDYPKQENIAAQQKSYIQSTVQSFESIMNSATYADTVKGYASVIDVNSFVDNLLLNEFCKNVDAYRLSTYFYKDKVSKNPKIFAGPIWDYNICFGNADYYDGWKPEGLHLTYLTTNTSFLSSDAYQVPFWWKKLMADKSFVQKLTARYVALRKTFFNESFIFGTIDSLTTSFSEARIRNFQEWPIFGTYVWPNYYIAKSFDDEISYLKSWITKRIQWMDSYFGYTGVFDTKPGLPFSFSLEQNYPNPFNPSTKLRFHVPVSERIKITVYDVIGNQVSILTDAFYNAGTHEITFSADNLASGVYFARCKAGEQESCIKMLLLR
jgi:hypothetical protein